VGIGVVPSAAYKMQVNVATNTVSTGSPAASSLFNIAGGTTTVGDGVSLQLTNTSGAKETGWRISAVTASGNNGDLVFNGYAGGADYPERMRIGAQGMITATSSVNDNYGLLIKNTNSTRPYGLGIALTNGTSNNTQALIVAESSNATKFIVYTNGNVGSATSSYGGISDLKLKENIVDAGSQWDDLKALRVRKYSFKEENSSEPTQIGVIAQEVEAAGMAGLVYETPDQIEADDGSIEDTEEVTKSMKYSVLYMKAIKALQEAMTRIETLEAKVQTLENN